MTARATAKWVSGFAVMLLGATLAPSAARAGDASAHRVATTLAASQVAATFPQGRRCS